MKEGKIKLEKFEDRFDYGKDIMSGAIQYINADGFYPKYSMKEKFNLLNPMGYFFIPMKISDRQDSLYRKWYKEKDEPDMYTEGKPFGYIRAKVLRIDVHHKIIYYCYYNDVKDEISILHQHYEGKNFRYCLNGCFLHRSTLIKIKAIKSETDNLGGKIV